MKFEKTVQINATPDEVWALVGDVEAVANCIPGLHDYVSTGPNEFDAIVTQQVGPVKSSFKLSTSLTDLDPGRSLTAVSKGRDSDLDSSVKAEQRFDLSPSDGGTSVAITADIAITGRIATFGHRIVATKAEQVVTAAIKNVSAVLEERRTASG
jgi:carbon monoxide dehydrogenase subunit G